MMRNDQRGFVSLLTVSLMAVLILLLTLAMTRLMSGELRQATDTADSIKAYYTAQGAAENAAQQLRTGVTTAATPSLNSLNQGCGGGNAAYPLPSPLATSLNCVAVTTSTNQVTETDLPQNQSQTYDLTNSVLTDGGNLTRMDLSWDDPSITGPSGSFTDPGTGAPGSTAPGVTTPWNTTCASCGNQPPVMELNITNYFPGQNTTSFTGSGTTAEAYSGTVYLVPRPDATLAAGSAVQTYDYVCYLSNTQGVPGNTATTNCPGHTVSPYPLMQVNCTTGAAQRCSAEITDLVPPATTGYRTVLTVTPLFHDAQFNLTAYATQPPPGSSATCTTDATTSLQATPDCVAPVALEDAEVDVTATVGNTTRRVELSVPVRTSQALSDVLEGDSDICKSFDVVSISGTDEILQPNADPTKPTCIINDNPGGVPPAPPVTVQGANYTSGSCTTGDPSAYPCVTDGSSVYSFIAYSAKYSMGGLAAGSNDQLTINYGNVNNGPWPPPTGQYTYDFNVYVFDSSGNLVSQTTAQLPTSASPQLSSVSLGAVPANATIELSWNNNYWINEPGGVPGSTPSGTTSYDPNLEINSVTVGPTN